MKWFENVLFWVIVFFLILGGSVVAVELGIGADPIAKDEVFTPEQKLVLACGEVSGYKVSEYSCDEDYCKAYLDINGVSKAFMWQNNVKERTCTTDKDGKLSCTYTDRDMNKEELEETKLVRAKAYALSLAKNACAVNERDNPKPVVVDGNKYDVTVR